MSDKTALLFGATGLVGGHCLDLLLRENSYRKVVAFARRPLAINNPRLQVELIDFERLQDYNHLIAGDDLFCCLGTTIRAAGSQDAFFHVDFTYPHHIATTARSNGVGQFLLVSSIGADPQSSVFYSRVKGELEQAIQRIPFSAIQLFRPSLLLGDRREFRFGERFASIASRAIAPLLLGSLRKYRPIEARDVAAAMVAVAGEDRAGVNIYESDAIAAIASGAS